MATAGEEPSSKKAKTGSGEAGDQMHECTSATVKDPISAIEAEADVEVSVEGHTLKVHAAVLGLTSPVFAALITSSMREGLTRRVELPGKTKGDFEMFLTFLRPLSRQQVNLDNVDRMLPLFDEYQVTLLKDEAESFLMRQPVSAARLVQAHRFCLQKQYEHCLKALSAEQFILELEELAAIPKIVQDLLPHVSKKSLGLARVCPIFERFLTSQDSFGSTAPILKVCLNHAAKLEPDEVSQILTEHTKPMPIIGALVARCFDAKKRQFKLNVKALSVRVHNSIDVVNWNRFEARPQPREKAKQMIDLFADSLENL